MPPRIDLKRAAAVRRKEGVDPVIRAIEDRGRQVERVVHRRDHVRLWRPEGRREEGVRRPEMDPILHTDVGDDRRRSDWSHADQKGQDGEETNRFKPARTGRSLCTSATSVRVRIHEHSKGRSLSAIWR
jgi:hypothetical protein